MNSKQKGARGERELAKALRDHGFNARRTQQYAGYTGDASDVIGLPSIHIECKRTERLSLYDALAQAKRDAQGKSLPTIFHRKNNSPWVVIMELDDWMKLYKAYYEELEITEEVR